jgi:hypothetical protein
MLNCKKLYHSVDDIAGYIKDKLVDRAYPARGQTFPPIILMALPKSGSVYLHTALRRVLQIQLLKVAYAVTFGESFRQEGLNRIAAGNALIREHFEAKDFIIEAMAESGIKKIVVHIRDPRAAILSWTRNMERSIKSGGRSQLLLHSQRSVPAAYLDWDFRERLSWQIDNHLPRYVCWIEGWLDAVAKYPQIDFLVTTYEEMAADNRAFVCKILDFHGIAYKDSWLKLPSYEIGKNNTFHAPVKSLADELGADLFARANAIVPAQLIERFNWQRLA